MKDFDLKLKMPPIPSDDALQIAARCWCDDETKTIEMDPRLATAFAKRLDLLWLSTAKERMLLEWMDLPEGKVLKKENVMASFANAALGGKE